MSDIRPASAGAQARIAVLTGDAEFEQLARTAFGGNGAVELNVVAGGLGRSESEPAIRGATAVLVDIDASHPEQVVALQALVARLGGSPPIVVVTQACSETVARRLLQIRVADFLVKPVSPDELVRACARVAQGAPNESTTEAQIFTFLPSAGGVGITTLAIQTAMLLL